MTVGGDRHQTILVVDDEPEVRQSTALLLEALDFRVLEAADGSEALAILESDPEVNLLFVDVVLTGGVNGAELARDAVAARPDLRVLLTSGRPDLVKDDRFPILGKPFRLSELDDRISRVLGSGSVVNC